MKKATKLRRTRATKNVNQRRILMKKVHKKVLTRRKQFASLELIDNEQVIYAQA